MLTVIATAAVLVAQAPPEIPTELLIRQATKTCTRNAKIVRRMFEIEAEEGMPGRGRGYLAAAFFQESSCLPHVRCGDKGASCGPVQWGRWARRPIRKVQRELRRKTGRRIPKGDPRRDLEAAARFWVRHMLRQYRLPEWVRYRCKGKRRYETRTDMLLASANWTAVGTPRKRCVKRERKCVEWGDGRECIKHKKVCVRRKWWPRCATADGRVGSKRETKHAWRLRQWRRAARAEMAASSAQ